MNENVNIRANISELESIGSNTKINGLKLILNCSKCLRKWSIWFRDENDLLVNLPPNFHICMTCKNNN